MNVCKMGLESIWIEHATGEVYMCGWTRYKLGNLTDYNIEELWQSEKAEIFRKSLLDGSYHYCHRKGCPYLANNKMDEMMVEYKVPEYPKYCSLSYEQQCNYVCKCCRKEHYIPLLSEKDNFKKIETEVYKFINNLEMLSANGVGEVFCSNSTLELLSKVKYNEKLAINLESNGSLFNEKNWNKINNLGRHNLSVSITVHSFNEDTYQFLSGTKLPISNIINNLHFISNLRKEGIINNLEIATVVCERNFREMPEFVQFCLDEFEADTIRLRFFNPHGVEPVSTEWFFDVRNPYHPYYEEFVKVMQHPVLKHPKVWKWQGESLSDFKEHPYIKVQANFVILQKLIKIQNFSEKIKNYFNEKKISSFALYCNGYLGQTVANKLDNENIRFGHIFDSNPCTCIEYCGHPVADPSEELVKEYDAIVITSTMHFQEIENTLKKCNYDGMIITIGEIIDALLCCNSMS